jgi:dihydroneopterin aldolase
MDVITIQDFRVETAIGFYEWERRLPQNIQLDIEFGLPGRHAATSDRIRDTIDYAAVVHRIRDSLSTTHFILLERLAEHIASILREEFKSPWVRVSATKSGILRGVRRVGITIERGSVSEQSFSHAGDAAHG